MCAIFLFIITSLVSQASDKLQIRIWTEKDQFFVHEPIPVHYEVKNISESTVRLSFGMIHEDFVIKDEQGRGYATHFRGSFSGGGDSLRPSESHNAIVDVSGYYGVTNVGEYTCYIYTQPSAVLHFPWTKSNTIKFKVIEPKGDEKKALDLFLEAEKLKYSRDKIYGGRDLKKAELGFLKYQELVDKYPNSIYAPLALQEAIGIYLYSENPEDLKKIIPVCLKLIENYQEDVFCDLVGLYEILKDKEGAIKTMKGLIEKHPNTKISERAGYWLEKIEKWEFK
jgi:hypothetical protein